jgi:hypothetical protein
VTGTSFSTASKQFKLASGQISDCLKAVRRGKSKIGNKGYANYKTIGDGKTMYSALTYDALTPK